MITRFDRADARTHFLDDRAAFVPEHGREQAFWVVAGQSERIGMANAGRDVADQDLALPGSVKVERFDFQWFACCPGDGGARFHGLSVSAERCRSGPEYWHEDLRPTTGCLPSRNRGGKRHDFPVQSPDEPGMSLQNLRDILSDVDRRIVDLIAERQRIVADIGRNKREDGAATRDYAREKDVLDLARARARELAVDPDLAERILRQLILSSLASQERDRVVAEARGDGRRALIIGGAGKMGGWFVDFFASRASRRRSRIRV